MIDFTDKSHHTLERRVISICQCALNLFTGKFGATRVDYNPNGINRPDYLLASCDYDEDIESFVVSITAYHLDQLGQIEDYIVKNGVGGVAVYGLWGNSYTDQLVVKVSVDIIGVQEKP